MKEINCNNCNGACCRGPLLMELTQREHDYLARTGTLLATVVEPSDKDRQHTLYPSELEVIGSAPNDLRIKHIEGTETYVDLGAGLGRYALLGDCGYLAQDAEGSTYCSAYFTRPDVCKDFEMGGMKCQIIRIMQGVDPEPADIRNLLQ